MSLGPAEVSEAELPSSMPVQEELPKAPRILKNVEIFSEEDSHAKPKKI